MKALFKEKGSSFRIDILQEPGVTDFIGAHSSVLDSAMEQAGVSDIMRQRLQQSNYVFSGMKTFHELNEAFPSLLDSDGNRKSFEQFYNDVRNIDNTYNKNYLNAEYNFVQASSFMAGRWEQAMQDAGRCFLQYRTAGDNKVRPEHAALNGVTLPVDDRFWEEFFPPNGWNCRCTAVEVRKDKSTPTPHDEAVSRGNEALKKDKKGMFHFNAGKEQRSVPKYNPYTLANCKTCSKYKTKLDFKPNNEVCAACAFIHNQIDKTIHAAEQIIAYDAKEWDYSYVSPKDNGFVVTQKERIKESLASKNEKAVFEKEMRMCKVIADNGHRVEYLQGVNRPAGQTYDIKIDGVKADLKCISGGWGNIVKYASKALTKQGGDAVLFEFPSHDIAFYKAIAEARRKFSGRIVFN